MTRTLLLHIGLPKTATTHLQTAVFPRLDHLRAISMPRARLFHSSGDAGEADRVLLAAFKRAPEVWDDLGEEIFAAALKPEEDDGRDVLLSEEGMGRAGSRPALMGAHLAALAGAARARGFGRVRALCMVRRQDRWLGSHYAQVSDRRPNAGQTDFEAFVDGVLDPRRDGRRLGGLLDYAALHRAAAAALGAGGTLFLPYEMMALDPEAFETALAAFLGGGERTKARLAALRAEAAAPRENVRSDGEGWRLRPRPSRLRLERLGLARRPGRVVLTPEQGRRIREAYASSNEAFAKAAGLDLARLGYLP